MALLDLEKITDTKRGVLEDNYENNAEHPEKISLKYHKGICPGPHRAFRADSLQFTVSYKYLMLHLKRQILDAHEQE